MATDSARTHYWQLPTFTLGVCAAIAAAKFTPPVPLAAAGIHSTSGAIEKLRQELVRRPLDATTLEAATRGALETQTPGAPIDSRTEFLIGSSYVALAESMPIRAAVDYWKLAAQHFNQVDVAQLTDKDDAKRFPFRFAKAKAATDTGNIESLLGILSTVPAGEEKSDAARLMAELFLKQTPPDLRRGREELARFLAMPNRLSTADSASYKLTLADISFQLKDAEQARRWLKDIKDGPAEVVAGAKLKLAQLARQDQDWPEVVKLLEAAQTGLSDDQRSAVRYEMGYAFWKQNNLVQAVPFLEQAAREPNATGAAAALRMADIRLKDASLKGRRSDVADWLDTAANRAPKAEELAQQNLPTREVRAIFEEAIQTALREADYASAGRMTTSYATFAEPGKDKERRAEVWSAWGQALATTQSTEAQAKYRQAAAEYTALAETFPTGAGQVDLIRRALSAAKLSGDRTLPLELARKLLNLPQTPLEDQAMAHLTVAEYAPAGDPLAQQSLEKAMQLPGAAGASARFRLAMTYLNLGKQTIDQAASATNPDAARKQGEAHRQLGRNLLQQVADATQVSEGEKDAHEKAVFELARRLMAEGQYADAEARFRRQVQLYPTGAEAGFGRLWLACCLVQQGYTGGPTDKRLQEAIELLSPLRSHTQEYIRTQADIRTLNALWVQQKYDEVLRNGQALLTTYSNKPD
ncbi:MAG: hypothetical protein ACRCZF_15870, partial [Gemmataceae bacterium]